MYDNSKVHIYDIHVWKTSSSKRYFESYSIHKNPQIVVRLFIMHARKRLTNYCFVPCISHILVTVQASACIREVTSSHSQRES